MPSKRVVVVSDLHCGHIVGLTPPTWDAMREEVGAEYLEKAYRQRRHIWDFYAKTLKELRPIDVLICNGDAIDGSGERVAGREMLIPDKNEQAKMAAQCLQEARAKSYLLTYGTGYHTGKDVDFEKLVAQHLDAMKVESVGHLLVNNVAFQYRHYISGSQVPHTRATAIAREQLWNALWEARGEYPKADVILRSHVHYFRYTGDGDWLGIVTPGLQGYGSIFGARTFSGLVDIGVIYFDVPAKGKNYDWDWRLCRMPRAKPVML